MTDTHTHLYLSDFKEDIDLVVARALDEGVEKFYLPAIDSSENEALLNLEKKFPGRMYAMAGLHPCSVKENYIEELTAIEQQLSQREFAAVGETGLDFYWDTTFSKQQYESLHTQAEWAIQYKLPLVLHTRNAIQEAINVVKEYKGKELKGIFHCFSGTLSNAKEIIDSGFILGIGGVVTFKNSGLSEVIKDIDLKYIVLETDAPYLAPVPYRGKRNESSYLKYIVQKIAEIKGLPVEDVASQTTENANQIFSKS